MAKTEPTIADIQAEMRAAQLKFARLEAPLLAEALASLSDEGFIKRVTDARDALPATSPAWNSLNNVLNAISAHSNQLRHYISLNQDMVRGAS